jgi:chorismate synthase
VEIGDGFAVATHHGATHGDTILPGGQFATNHDGGVLGGISNGAPIEVKLAIKPTSSILVPRQSVDVDDQPIELITKGRHDPCVGIRATPIAEALLALVLIEHALRDRAQCADVLR